MDEQNPRVNADDMRGRSDERVTGYAAAERSPAASPSQPETARTREIRAEIAHTRGELSETVNAIQDRLRPSNLAADATQSVKDAALDRARAVGESEPVMYARSNPIPSVMVGVGIIGAAWLAFAGRDDRSYDTRRRTGDANWRRREPSRSDDYDYGQDYSGTATFEGPAGAAYSSQAYAARGQEPGPRYGVARSGLRRTGRSSGVLPDVDSIRRTWDDSPLLVGAAAAIAGAIVGLSVPETEREHQLMGETRDAMLQNVQETVREKVNEVQQAASDAANTVQKIATGGTGSVP
jgi:hypothetical protein